MAVTATFISSNSLASFATTATFTSQSIGTAATDRLVFVGILQADTAGNISIHSVTNVDIGGVTATLVPSSSITISNVYQLVWYWAPFPTGTTATITVTVGGASTSNMGIHVYNVTGANTTTPYSGAQTGSGGNTHVAFSSGLTVPASGELITAAHHAESGATPVFLGFDLSTYDNDITFPGQTGATSDLAVGHFLTPGSATDGATWQSTGSGQIISGVALQPPSTSFLGLPFVDPVRARAGLSAALIATSGSFGPVGLPLTGAVPVTFDGPPPAIIRTQYQARAYVPFTPPVVAPSFDWFYPFTEPVRSKPALNAGLQQSFTIGSPPIIPSFGWFAPYSDPTRIPPGTTTKAMRGRMSAGFSQVWYPHDSWPDFAQGRRRVVEFPQPAFVQFIPPPPQVWYPHDNWPDILRPKINLDYQDLEIFFGVPAVSTDWFQAWSEPVRTKPGLLTGLQQFLAYGPVPITVPVPPFDWFYPYTEPVRSKPALRAGLQQSFTIGSPPIIPSFGWFGGYAEPVRTKPGLLAGLQQFYTFGIPPIAPPAISFDWFYPYTEPVRTKPGLIAGLQQTYAFGRPPIVPSFGWFDAYAEPVRTRPALLTDIQPFYTAGTKPITPSMGWNYGWNNPVRIRLGLLPGLQQFYTFGTPTIIFTNVLRLDATEQGDLFSGVIYSFSPSTWANVSIVQKPPVFANVGIAET